MKVFTFSGEDPTIIFDFLSRLRNTSVLTLILAIFPSHVRNQLHDLSGNGGFGINSRKTNETENSYASPIESAAYHFVNLHSDNEEIKIFT